MTHPEDDAPPVAINPLTARLLAPARAWMAERRMKRRTMRMVKLATKAIAVKQGENRIDVVAKHGFVWVLLSTDSQRHAIPLHPDTAGDVSRAISQSMRLARGQRQRRTRP